MRGLTVRWSLADAPDGVEEELATRRETSHARFTGMAGLAFKRGGCAAASGSRGPTCSPPTRRAEFQRAFVEGAAEAPGSRIIGSPPILVEECDVVAIAEEADGFTAASPDRPSYDGRCSRLRRPDLLGAQQPVTDGQQHGHERLVAGDRAAEVADRHRLLVALGGVGHPVVPGRCRRPPDGAAAASVRYSAYSRLSPSQKTMS